MRRLLSIAPVLLWLAGDTRQLREGEGRNQPEKDRCDRKQTTHQDLPPRLSKFFMTD